MGAVLLAHRSEAFENRWRLALDTFGAAGLKVLVLVLVHELWGSKNRGIAVLESIGAAIVVLWLRIRLSVRKRMKPTNARKLRDVMAKNGKPFPVSVK